MATPLPSEALRNEVPVRYPEESAKKTCLRRVQEAIALQLFPSLAVQDILRFQSRSMRSGEIRVDQKHAVIDVKLRRVSSASSKWERTWCKTTHIFPRIRDILIVHTRRYEPCPGKEAKTDLGLVELAR